MDAKQFIRHPSFRRVFALGSLPLFIFLSSEFSLALIALIPVFMIFGLSPLVSVPLDLYVPPFLRRPMRAFFAFVFFGLVALLYIYTFPLYSLAFLFPLSFIPVSYVLLLYRAPLPEGTPLEQASDALLDAFLFSLSLLLLAFFRDFLSTFSLSVPSAQGAVPLFSFKNISKMAPKLFSGPFGAIFLFALSRVFLRSFNAQDSSFDFFPFRRPLFYTFLAQFTALVSLVIVWPLFKFLLSSFSSWPFEIFGMFFITFLLQRLFLCILRRLRPSAKYFSIEKMGFIDDFFPWVFLNIAFIFATNFLLALFIVLVFIAAFWLFLGFMRLIEKKIELESHRSLIVANDRSLFIALFLLLFVYLLLHLKFYFPIGKI